jgi:hypothetical protein
MKKLLLAVALAAVASTAMGAVGVEFGANWYKPNMDVNGNGVDFYGQGQNMAICWALDEGLMVGAYVENTMMNDGYGNMNDFSVNAIQLRKGIVKGVAAGINLGVFNENYNNAPTGYTGMLTDVFGELTILGGKAEKIEGALKGQVGGRWADAGWQMGSANNWNGYFINLLVSLLI